MLSDFDLGYAAGVFDGEGTLSLHSRYKYGTNVHVLTIVLTNNHFPLLYWFQENFGGVVRSRTDHAGQWKLERVSEQVSFLKTFAPLLRIKRRQAELLLEYRETVGPVGPAISQETLEHRNKIVQEVYSLNGARTGKPSRQLLNPSGRSFLPASNGSYFPLGRTVASP